MAGHTEGFRQEIPVFSAKEEAIQPKACTTDQHHPATWMTTDWYREKAHLFSQGRTM